MKEAIKDITENQEKRICHTFLIMKGLIKKGQLFLYQLG
jgi:hypothetical protein